MFGLDEKFKGTKIAKFFEVEERGSSLSGELKGAVATFMTMAYILAVNPRILADSGGPCIPDDDGIAMRNYYSCMGSDCGSNSSSGRRLRGFDRCRRHRNQP